MNLLSYITGITLSGLSAAGFATDVTQINRYATVSHKPQAAQVNPLKAVQHMHFPEEVKCIGDAVDYWLRHSGYHLSAQDKQPDVLKQVLSQPLPQVDRTLGPLSIADGVLVLIGHDVFSLKAEPFTREIILMPKGGDA